MPMEEFHVYVTVAVAVTSLIASFLGGTFYLGVKFSRIHDDIASLKSALTDIRQELKSMNIMQNRLSILEEKVRRLEEAGD